MHVLDVATGEDGSVLLEVESDDVLTGCPDCGVVAIGHGRRVQLLHDAPCFGRPVRVRWRWFAVAVAERTKLSPPEADGFLQMHKKQGRA